MRILSKRRAGSDRLLSDALIYGIGTILQRALAFILLPIVTRLLGPDQFGLAGLAISVAAVLSIVYNGGVTFSIVRLYYDEPTEAHRTVWASLIRIQVALAAGLAALTWLLGPLWSGVFQEARWGPVMKLAVVYALAQAIQKSAQSVLRAARRPTAFLAVALLQTVIGATLGIYLAAGHGAAGYVGGLTVGALVASIAGVALGYRRPLWHWKALRAGIAISVPFVIHQLSLWILDLSDRVLIERYVGLSELASYQVAYVVGSIVTILLTSLNSAWAPHFFGGLSNDEKQRLPAAIAFPVNLACGAASALLVLAAPILLRVAAPPEFRDVQSQVIVALVAGATSIKASYFLAVTALFDLKDSRWIGSSSLLGAVLNIVLNILLIPRYGALAAAVTTIVAMTLQTLLIIARSNQIGKYHFRSAYMLSGWFGSLPILIGLALLPSSLVGHIARAFILPFVIYVGWKGVATARERYLVLTTRSRHIEE